LVAAVNDPIFVAKQRQAKRFAGNAARTSKPLEAALARLLRKIGQREINRAVRRGDLRIPINKAVTQAEELEMLRLLRTFGLRRADQSGRQTSRSLGTQWLFRPVVVERFLETSEIKIKEYLRDANVELANRVKEVLVEAERAEVKPTIAQMTATLEKRMLDTGAFSPARAERIARTETATAQTFGIHQGMKLAGVEQKEWIAILDNRVRPLHADMNGVIVGIDEFFVLDDGTKMRFPGDPTAPAKHRVNCRCQLVAPRLS
jgi:SPP1 gp7 family putative phage head morphogenesis protein